MNPLLWLKVISLAVTLLSELVALWHQLGFPPLPW
jgi:hypothetical protein